MKKIFFTIILSCLLCSFVGCSTEQKDIPFNGAYNEKKDILITLGMHKDEVNALLGEYELLYKTEYTYFLDDPEHKLIILYDEYVPGADNTVRCIFIDNTNWSVHDKSCYVGAPVSGLSESFKDVTINGSIVATYYDENGNVLYANIYDYMKASIKARQENDCIYRVSVENR